LERSKTPGRDRHSELRPFSFMIVERSTFEAEEKKKTWQAEASGKIVGEH